MKVENAEWRMKFAIQAAEIGIALGQSPFGAAIFSENGDALAIVHNRVKSDIDPSGHAEVIAIRTACAKLGQTSLAGCELVSTCEPCPMCASAIVFSGIRSVVFGASVQDAKRAGFDQLQLPATLIFDECPEMFQLRGGILVNQCVQLFERNS
ncbi:nucleoside deaminase [Rhodopirellula sp. MGV]|uniref:nucleoside deaminase n=1 Tax=Rhodopirellula sp. MGV TaxID=2023130 RepID=UPI000B96F925|nr:nucleoside deaminase [Rhodopirellula sp. MGV]OYP28893.1 hypothetical protein CGZ80_25325 [Rhodopirellula sp. MGV]PNY36990.1 nucleoside deaminase [Rhodopirellula baltica]